MQRSELLKALHHAIEIFERLEAYTRADGDLHGIATLHEAKHHLQMQVNDLVFAPRWKRKR